MIDRFQRIVRSPLMLWLVALLLGSAFWGSALQNWEATGVGDWQYFHHQWEAAYAAVMRYGELPLWDPWHCGGVFLFGDPQAQIYSPFFLVALLIGTVGALKLMLIVHTAAGFAGVYVIARRRLGVHPVSAATAGVIFTACGFFAWHHSGGHVSFVPFYLIPWVWIAWRRACEDWTGSWFVAALFALTIFEGGVYPFAYFALLVAFDGAVLVAESWRRWRKVLQALLVSALLTGLLAAFRLLPIMDTMSSYPRPTAEKDVLSFAEVCAMLTSVAHNFKLPGHEYVWAEYGSFIGWSSFLLGIIGLVYAAQGQRWLIAGALFFLGLTMGHFSDFSPWALVHKLPVFGSLRVPSRFVVLLIFFLALGAALAIERLVCISQEISKNQKIKRIFGWALPLLVLVGVTVHIQSGHKKVINRWAGPVLPAFEASADYHLTTERYDGSFAGFPARGISHRGCYTGMTYTAAPGLWSGQKEQARVPAAVGAVKDVSRTANTITIQAQMRAAGDITINQTWARDWTSDTGTLSHNAQGLITVEALPAGDHTIKLTYAPRQFWSSALLSVLGLCAVVGVGFVYPRMRAKKNV